MGGVSLEFPPVGGASLEGVVLKVQLSYAEEGAIFVLSTASRSKGKIPHFLNPFLMLTMEKAISNGSFMTLVKSRFETMKSVLVKQNTHRHLEKCTLSDLNTETSSGCNAWVVCGGRQRRITWFSLDKSMSSKLR